MKKIKVKRMGLLIVLAFVLGLGGCELLEQDCTAEGCESEIYEDDLCKYHYTLETGENALKNWFNGE